MLCGCRAFGVARRHDRFDLLRVPTRGFTPAGHRQVQLKLVWRLLCGHETSGLLALSFNPSSGTVRAFSRRAGLLRLLLTSASRSGPLTVSSVPKDTTQISRSKPDSLHRTPAGFTVLVLDGCGLRECLPARPTSAASYPVSVRRVATLLHASFRRSLAVPPLRFASASPPSGCTGDFHPQAAGHVRHTGCSLRSHRLRRLKPLTPTLSPATHSAMPSMLPCCTSDLKRHNDLKSNIQLSVFTLVAHCVLAVTAPQAVGSQGMIAAARTAHLLAGATGKPAACDGCSGPRGRDRAVARSRCDRPPRSRRIRRRARSRRPECDGDDDDADGFAGWEIAAPDARVGWSPAAGHGCLLTDFPGTATPTAACPRSPSPSPARAGTAPGSDPNASL